MNIAYIVVAVVLSALLAGSAVGKIRRTETVTTNLARARVPVSWFPLLAAIELAAVAGLLIGIAWRPLGVAAAVGVVLYFIGALGAHVRARDSLTGMTAAGVHLALGILATVFGFASL